MTAPPARAARPPREDTTLTELLAVRLRPAWAWLVVRRDGALVAAALALTVALLAIIAAESL